MHRFLDIPSHEMDQVNEEQCLRRAREEVNEQERVTLLWYTAIKGDPQSSPRQPQSSLFMTSSSSIACLIIYFFSQKLKINLYYFKTQVQQSPSKNSLVNLLYDSLSSRYIYIYRDIYMSRIFIINNILQAPRESVQSLISCVREEKSNSIMSLLSC